MSVHASTALWTLLGLASAAPPLASGQVLPAEPIAAQATAGPTLEHPDYLERPGNVPAGLDTAAQLGPAEAEGPMARMILALKPPPGAMARLEQCLAEQQDSRSPRYHQWLTPEQFGAAFGPSQEALERVTGWLQACGFTIDNVAAGRLAITFSGTVRQVEQAFRTAIRIYRIGGQVRQANSTSPSIPRALADVVEGVVSLHNIPRPALNRGFTPLPGDGPRREADEVTHILVPGDFALIYNVNPLYREGFDGTGVTIAVVGRTHIPLSDVAAFRRDYGLGARLPEIILNGPDPGDLGSSEDGEADLDVEWSGAVARNASIRFVVSGSTDSTDGVDLSAQYIVNHNLAPIMTTSFGQCEKQMGSTEVVFFKQLWAQAAAQGITSLVASGDSGPAGCNSGSDHTGSGPAVSGLASTPNDVAVGGTEFNEGSGVYWLVEKRRDESSALGYIPETAWNESGASPGGSGLWSSGGGISGIHPRPSWQMAPGVPSDARYRCLPDVSLTAASHDGYLVRSNGMQMVTGGTSCSAPALAGIMALVVQKTGERQGNPNPTFYSLGRAQYQGTGPVVFHDTVQGDTNVPGTQGYPCTPGYDLATGLGSVDAHALASAWTGGTGTNVEAFIHRPASDLTVANGACVAFSATAHDSNPNAAMTYRWDFGDGATASGIASGHVFRNPGPAPVTYVVAFTAQDESGAEGAATRNITVTPKPTPGERIVNGSFEYGDGGWTFRNVSIGNNSPIEPAHLGQADAWFSGWFSNRTGLLQQTVQIPAGAASARLTFWLHVDSFSTDTQARDLFQLKVRGADGRLLILDTSSNLDAAPGYQQHSIDLGAFRGQRVQLSFVGSYSSRGQSSYFVLDDVSLIAP